MGNGYMLVEWIDRKKTLRTDYIECVGLYAKKVAKFNEYVASVGGQVVRTMQVSSKEGPRNVVQKR